MLLLHLLLSGGRAGAASSDRSSGGNDAAASGQRAPQSSVAGPGARGRNVRRNSSMPPGRGPDTVLQRRRDGAPLGQRGQGRRTVGGGRVRVPDDDAAAAARKLPPAADLLLLVSLLRHRSGGDRGGPGRRGSLGERIRGAQQVLAVEVLLLLRLVDRSKLELVSVVVVVDCGSDAARRSQLLGLRGAVGAAGEGPYYGVVGLECLS